jgi:hypothetical protein
MSGSLTADHRIRIVSGAYGVGKTEFAVNYALELAGRGCEVVLVDLDIVNPYFTSRCIRDFLDARGVTVLGPAPEHTLVDIPALPAEIFSVFHKQDAEVIIDLGGDAPGSRVMGCFYPHLMKYGYDLFYLVNLNCPYTRDLAGALEYYAICERSTRLKITKIVNSTHLLFDTSVEDILAGYEVCRRLSDSKQVKLAYNMVWRETEDREALPELEGETFWLDMTLRPWNLDVRGSAARHTREC